MSSRGNQPRRFTRTWRRTIIAVGVLAVLTIVAGFLWWRQAYTTRAMRLLVNAFDEQRPIKGRLTGGFKGGRFVPPSTDAYFSHPQEINEAARLIDAALNRDDPAAKLAKARLLFLTNDNQQVTLWAFRKAVAAAPTSFEAHNDLGACLLERGNLEDALTEFDTALKENPTAKEVLFNRALCYEQMQLRNAASSDWEQLLSSERDPGWKAEAQQHYEKSAAEIAPSDIMTGIEQTFDDAIAAHDDEEAIRIADQNLSYVLSHGFGVSAPQYLESVSRGDTAAAQKELHELEIIANRLFATSKDKSIQDLVDYLKRLDQQSCKKELDLISHLIFIMRNGSLAADEAERALEKLKDEFKQRGNDLFFYYASNEEANAYYNTGKYASYFSKVKDLVPFVKSRDWPYKLALLLQSIGIAYSRLGQDSLGLEYCEQALQQPVSLPAVRASANQYLGTIYWHLGNIPKGIDCLRRSSDVFTVELPSLRDLSYNSLTMADFYRQLNQHPLALLHAQQAFQYVVGKDAPDSLAEITSFIAVELAQLKRFDESDAELKQAFDYVSQISSNKGNYSQSLVLLRAGEIASLRGDLPQAVAEYSKTEDIIEHGEERSLPMIRLRHARAEAYDRAGMKDQAFVDLQQAIQLIEGYREGITEQNNRSNFLDASHEVYDQMVQIQAEGYAAWKEAFDISEQARARTLLDEYSTFSQRDKNSPTGDESHKPLQSGKALTLEQIQAALPDDLTLISYSVTDAGTFIFVITQDKLTGVKSDVTTEALDHQVQDYLSALNEQAPLNDLSELSRQLYQKLIAPIEPEIAGSHRLCIIPDKSLHTMPFRALRDGNDKYLLESFDLTSAPSASILALCLAEAKGKGARQEEKMLAFGAPLIDRKDFPELVDLPDAAREAKESADFYPQKQVLTGPNATKEALRTALKDCDVAHLATHCLIDGKTPWQAALLVTADRDVSQADRDNEMLRLSDIYGFHLPRTRLVVLSACQSGLGQYYRGEGIVSLARPFLALGVPTVVVSLWPVNSEATTALMINFHNLRAAHGQSTADALRAAQIDMMHSPSYSHPYFWAPFVVVGSGN